jgi:tetratricopeptide (TPR) repeat protein
MPTRVWLAAMLFVLATASLAPAAPKWVRLRTAHFELVGDVSEKQLKQAGLRFEQFRETFTRLFPHLRHAPAPVVVVVFGSKKAYQPFMPVYNGKRVDVGGYFMSRPDVNYITLAMDGGADAWRIIFHEYTHLLIGASLADVPVCVNEGLAEYYSTFEASGDGREATIGTVIESHVYLLRERFIPLRELIAVAHDSPLYNEGNRRSIFYAESWALMHFFLVAKPERRAQLQKYLELYADGRPAVQAFEEAFGADQQTLERELREYVAQPIYRSITYKLRDPIEIDRSATAQPLTEADGETVLGDLLLHAGRLDEASARLERARTLAPDHVRATATLGRVRHLQSRDDESRTLLADAAARAGDDYLPLYYQATTLLRPQKGALAGLAPEKAAASQATALLEKVVERQPNHADALALLGYGRLVTGDLAAAVQALAKAHDISPRHEYALLAAQAYLANRQLGDARRVLTLLADRGDSPSLKASARELLERTVSVEFPNATAERRTTSAGAPSTSRPSADAAGVVPVFRKVEAGETRETGVLQEIACSTNAIVLVVNLPGRVARFGAADFLNIAFISFRPELTGGVSCGRRASPEQVYVTWRDAGGPPGTDGRAIAVEFLPAGFTP